MTRKAFYIAVFGVAVQYYDNHLFGLLASKISKHFIPASDPIVQLLHTYFIMAIAVGAKPVGALVLGRIGDLYGRSTTIDISLVGTAIGSLVISLIPGYHHIGIMSALILLVARMCICAFCSSGTDGVRLFIYEQIGKNKQCFGNGLVVASTLTGTLIAALSAWFFTLDILPSYSWRFAFACGSIMGISMVFVRKISKVNDDLATSKEEANYDEFKNTSIWKILRSNFKLFLLCLAVGGSISSTNQFFIIFFGTYVSDVLHLVEPSRMKFYTSVAIGLYIVFAIIGGLAADFFGRKKVAFAASFVLLLMTPAMMVTMHFEASFIPLFFSNVIVLPFLIMPTLAFLKQSIPKVIRYRIFSLAHAVGSICIGTPTAWISVFTYKQTAIVWLPVIYFFITIIIITFGIYMLCKKHGANKY